MMFNFIKAAQFFPSYCPSVKDWKKKMTNKNGRGNYIEFSPTDNKAIKAGLKQLFKDISNDFKELK